MLQGLEEEDAIADSFIDKMEEGGNHNLTFIRCGFFISKTHGFFGASPDRIVHDQTEETPGVAVQIHPGKRWRNPIRSPVTRGGSRFERAAQISTILFALCHSVALMTPCKILKFFICSIFCST